MSKSPILQRATQADAPLLENLLELYIHDLSEIFPIEIGPNGRFGYDRLAQYWSDPANRRAFLIQSEQGVAGFALVLRGSPASDDPEALDVGEFFVLRRHRRSGIGRAAAIALWDELPGSWVVRVSKANRAGIPFWTEVIRAYSGGDFAERTLPGNPNPWSVFTFESRASSKRR
jgi:predicted acetyltransferase